jgi:hypothetical protein
MSRNPVLAFRSLLARPSRTLFTLLGVVLGVAVILAISITNLSTLDSITTLFIFPTVAVANIITQIVLLWVGSSISSWAICFLSWLSGRSLLVRELDLWLALVDGG